MLNIPLTAFAFVSGAVAIRIGFGAQNIINNFISGWNPDLGTAHPHSEVLTQAVNENKDVLKDPGPQIIFEDFGTSALIFDVYFWVNMTSERGPRLVRSELRFEIMRLFEKAEISIAFAQRDVHIDGALLISKPTSK